MHRYLPASPLWVLVLKVYTTMSSKFLKAINGFHKNLYSESKCLREVLGILFCFRFILFLIVCVYGAGYVHVNQLPVVAKSAGSWWGWSYRQLWALWRELRSSPRAACAINHWTIYPPPSEVLEVGKVQETGCFVHLYSEVMIIYAEAGGNILTSARFYFLLVCPFSKNRGSKSHILPGLFIILVLSQ